MGDTIIIVVRRPFSWLKLFQLIGGLICFGLLFHYRAEIFQYVLHGADVRGGEDFVRMTFTVTAIVGYPFVIVLLTLIAIGASGTSLETSVLVFLLNFVGFGMYLTVGGIVAYYANKYDSSDAVKGFAAMCIITSFLFLCDVIIALLQRCRK